MVVKIIHSVFLIILAINFINAKGGLLFKKSAENITAVETVSNLVNDLLNQTSNIFNIPKVNKTSLKIVENAPMNQTFVTGQITENSSPKNQINNDLSGSNTPSQDKLDHVVLILKKQNLYPATDTLQIINNGSQILLNNISLPQSKYSQGNFTNRLSEQLNQIMSSLLNKQTLNLTSMQMVADMLQKEQESDLVMKTSQNDQNQTSLVNNTKEFEQPIIKTLGIIIRQSPYLTQEDLKTASSQEKQEPFNFLPSETLSVIDRVDQQNESSNTETDVYHPKLQPQLTETLQKLHLCNDKCSQLIEDNKTIKDNLKELKQASSKLHEKVDQLVQNQSNSEPKSEEKADTPSEDLINGIRMNLLA